MIFQSYFVNNEKCVSDNVDFGRTFTCQYQRYIIIALYTDFTNEFLSVLDHHMSHHEFTDFADFHH